MFGKRSPSWEAPYKVIKVIFNNPYMLKMLQGGSLLRAINERYLKRHFPSVRQEAYSTFQTMACTCIAFSTNKPMYACTYIFQEFNKEPIC
jgi:hypothetical protein